jgi:hypothetical protein
MESELSLSCSSLDFTAPDSPNEYTAKGFIGLRSFLGRLGKNGALIDIFASRMCQTGVQDAATNSDRRTGWESKKARIQGR